MGGPRAPKEVHQRGIHCFVGDGVRVEREFVVCLLPGASISIRSRVRVRCIDVDVDDVSDVDPEAQVLADRS